MLKAIPWPLLTNHFCSAVGAQITSPPLGLVISSCPDYLHADVSDGVDLSLHQQEVTDGQLVTKSLVPGTVDSDATSECHICCPPPLPTGKVSSFDSSRGLCASRLDWRKEKRKVAWAFRCLFPLVNGTECGPGKYRHICLQRVHCVHGYICVVVLFGERMFFLSFFLSMFVWFVFVSFFLSFFLSWFSIFLLCQVFFSILFFRTPQKSKFAFLVSNFLRVAHRKLLCLSVTHRKLIFFQG